MTVSYNNMKKVWRSINEISLIGLKAILNKKSPILRRIIWIILLIICFTLMLAQCVDRITHYTNEPVRDRVRIKYNNTLEYPSITICPVNYQFPNVIPTDLKKLLGQGYNYTCWFGRGLKCEKRGKWSVIDTVYGNCFTYTLSESFVNEAGTFRNFFMRVFLSNPENKTMIGVVYHVHKRHKPPPIEHMNSKGILITNRWSREVKIELRKFHLINRKKSPCIHDNVSYDYHDCIQNCFSNLIFNQINCTLPFMMFLDNNLRQVCNEDKYENGFKISRRMLTTHWLKNCTCIPSCEQIDFLTYPETSNFIDNQLKTRIYYENLVYEEVKQESGYSLNSLISDLGSTLGLLMGVSLLTIIEIIEVILSYLANNCNYSRHSMPSPIAVRPVNKPFP